MSREQKREQMDAYVEVVPDPTLNHRDLSEALYTASEIGMWPDSVDSVGVEQAILCWKIIEKVKKDGFPKELRM